MATVTAVALGLGDGRPAVVAWLTAHGVLAALRLEMTRRFRRARPGGAAIRPWLRAYSVLALAAGLTWASALGFVTGVPIDDHALFVGIALSGVIGGAVASASAHPPAFVALAGPILAGFIAWALLGTAGPLWTLAAAAMLYGIMATTANRRFNALLSKTISLRYENEDLLAAARREGAKLQAASEVLRREQELASHVMASFVGPCNQVIAGLRKHTRPLHDFNGDVLLHGHARDGRYRILLGDATGHGLSAALAAIPVAQTFAAVNRKPLSLETLLEELNANLRQLLPPYMFMAAALVEFTEAQGDHCRVRVWNGGVDDLILVRASGTVELLPSRNLALGILDRAELHAEFADLRLHAGDRLYLYSDGVTEFENQHGEPFGRERLQRALAPDTAGDHLQRALDELAGFGDGHPAQDDITLLEIDATALIAALRETGPGEGQAMALVQGNKR